MSTLLKPLSVREELLKRKIRVFTPPVFSRTFPSSPESVKYFLEKQVQEKLFFRLKKGIYALKTDPPIEEEIANVLYRPSYISFEYALAYYGILPEMPHIVTSATTKSTRLFVIESASFSYRTIKIPAYTGYILIKKESRSFLIAEPEKALADYLYFVSLRQETLNDRLIAQAKHQVNKTKLQTYINLFNNQQLKKLAREII